MEPKSMKDQEVSPVMPGADGKSDPKTAAIIKKAKGYETVLKTLLHGEKTRDEVINMLKPGGDPLFSVPQAAMAVNDMAMHTMQQGGQKPDTAVQMVASQYLVDDLLELGVASQSFQIEGDPEGIKAAVIEDTYQMYIERGLDDKSIDPIQLQLEAEKVMSEEQTVGGLMMGQGQVPRQPNQQAVIEQYAQGKADRKVKSMEASQAKKQAKEKQAALTQTALKGGQ